MASDPGPPPGDATGGTGSSGRAGRSQGRRILGLPVPVVIGGGAALVALAVIWWRRRSGSSTGATSSATRTSATSSTDTEGQLEQLQAELDQLSGAFNAQGGGGAATTTKTGTTTTAKTTATTKTAAPTGDLAAPAGRSDTPLPGGTSVDLGWTPVAGAKTYHYQVLQGNDVSSDQVTNITHARVTGLHPSTAYRWRVGTDQPRGHWSGFTNFKTKAK